MNWTRFVFFVMFFSCFCPNAPFISLFRMDRASHYFFVTHIVWILWISSAKPTVNVYVVVCWRLYLHMCFYVFSHYTEFWYCTSVNFTGWGPCLSDRVRWTVWPGSALRWFNLRRVYSCREGWATGGSRAVTKKRKKCQRSHSGREELQVIPRSHGVWGRNVKRPVSSEPISVRAEALLAVTPLYSSSFSGINESASVLPLLLPGIIQGLSNQAHSFIFFCVPFCKSFPWITA